MRKCKHSTWSTVIVSLVVFMAFAGAALAKSGDRSSSNSDNKKAPTAADFIKRLDKDGDGKVSKTEFDGPSEHFTRFDKNKDSYISEDEAPTGPPKKRGGRQGGQGKERSK